jgi:hypothetical protein
MARKLTSLCLSIAIQMACIKEREAKTHKMEGLYEAFCYGVTK